MRAFGMVLLLVLFLFRKVVFVVVGFAVLFFI